MIYKLKTKFEAHQYTGDNDLFIERWSNGVVAESIDASYLSVRTSEGYLVANKWDYVVRDESGNFFPVNMGTFENDYEECK